MDIFDTGLEVAVALDEAYPQSHLSIVGRHMTHLRLTFECEDVSWWIRDDSARIAGRWMFIRSYPNQDQWNLTYF
jgi:hypothetical protein